jgi:hypothetical protein
VEEEEEVLGEISLLLNLIKTGGDSNDLVKEEEEADTYSMSEVGRRREPKVSLLLVDRAERAVIALEANRASSRSCLVTRTERMARGTACFSRGEARTKEKQTNHKTENQQKRRKKGKKTEAEAEEE